MNLETMQREGREGFRQDFTSDCEGNIDCVKGQLDKLDQHTANVWKAALNSLLESGLLEEKEEHQDWCKLTGELEYSSCGCWKDHNTLARDIKEFMSNMDKV